MNRILTGLVALSLVAWVSSPVLAGPIDIAVWTFEVSVPVDAGPHEAEGGANAGAGSLAKGFHDSQATVWSNPVGNGSFESFSSNNWTIGDYYQFCTSTEGYTDIGVNWDQTASNTGPRDFLLQASWSGKDGPFEDILEYQVSPVTWSSTTFQAQSRYKEDLSWVEELNNAAEVCFRLVMITDVSANGGTVGTAGSNRVDNLVIKGVPEPGTLGLLALGALFLRRRR